MKDNVSDKMKLGQSLMSSEYISDNLLTSATNGATPGENKISNTDSEDSLTKI